MGNSQKIILHNHLGIKKNPYLVLYSIGLDYIKSHLKQQMEVYKGEASHSSEDEDFFSVIKKSRSQDDTSQLETYLNCPAVYQGPSLHYATCH